MITSSGQLVQQVGHQGRLVPDQAQCKSVLADLLEAYSTILYISRRGMQTSTNTSPLGCWRPIKQAHDHRND